MSGSSSLATSTFRCPMADLVRVLRLIEYIGPRDEVEEQLQKSIKTGEMRRVHNKVVVRATTIGDYPEVLNARGWSEEQTKFIVSLLWPGEGVVPEEATNPYLEADKVRRVRG